MNRSAAVERFYTSRAWRTCRASFVESKGGMCEECLKNGIIETGSKEQPLEAHHRIPLTDQNIRNPAIALSWDNMELLCKKCHDKKKKKQAKRWKVDPEGRVQI